MHIDERSTRTEHPVVMCSLELHWVCIYEHRDVNNKIHTYHRRKGQPASQPASHLGIRSATPSSSPSPTAHHISLYLEVPSQATKAFPLAPVWVMVPAWRQLSSVMTTRSGPGEPPV